MNRVDSQLPLMPMFARQREHLIQLKVAVERRFDASSFALGVCGCSHGAGTTTVALGLAEMFAETAGGKVVYVEANLRSPRLHKRPGVSSDAGFSHYLSGRAGLDEVVQRPKGQRAYLIASGASDSSDGAVVYPANRLPLAVESLRNAFGRVIFDLPPVGLYSDVTTLGPQLDGMMMVLRFEQNHWEAGESGKRLIETSGGRLIGAVLNRKRYYIPDWLYRLL